MSVIRGAALALLGLTVAACGSPRPDYTAVQMAPAYRTGPDGVRIDNENFQLDAEGYRLDKRGRRIGDVDIQAKMKGETSNAVAGYYISTIGADAPGRVATPSEGAGAGPGQGPGSATVTPAMTPAAAPVSTPGATTAPTPLSPGTR